MDKKHKKKAEKIIKEFIKKSTFDFDFEMKDEEDCLNLKLSSEEGQVFIGQQGVILSDLQSILGRIIRKQIDSPLYLNVDINQYKENKEKYLQGLAQETANRVSLEHKEQALFPMNAFERRVIHLELQKRSDIKTESIGIGSQRRVVVKPA